MHKTVIKPMFLSEMNKIKTVCRDGLKSQSYQAGLDQGSLKFTLLWQWETYFFTF